MKKLAIIASIALSVTAISANAAPSILTCSYDEPAGKAFVIDLKECFKSLPIPFEDQSWFEFVDYQHPSSVSISGHYLLGQGTDKNDLNLSVYKRNFTLAVQGQVKIHYSH